ncbi:MAG: S41 family peptidase [Limnochordia bacterium]
MFLAILLVTLAVCGSLAIARQIVDDKEPGEELRTVLEVIALVKTQYVDPVEAVDLLRAYVDSGSINGMLAAVLKDPYTRHMDVQAFSQMQIDTTGHFAGIGIMVGLKDDRLTVIAPIENTPAHRAGLRGGDRIIAIESRSSEFMSLDEAVSLMRGKEGTKITLTIERGTTPPFEVFDVMIIRDVIEVPSVTDVVTFQDDPWPVSEPVGYIRLTQFSERSSQELEEALQSMASNRVRRLILDLRNNPGGLLTAAVEVSSKFLDGGPVVHVVGRKNAKKTYTAFSRTTYDDFEMVVLVNGFSASASEIVAGALQDRGVATVVGERTFGKGLVQVVIPMRDGSALSLTSARYQTAGGRFIDKTGIEPDVEVKLDEELLVEIDASSPSPKDPQLLKALEILENGGIGDSLKKAG